MKLKDLTQFFGILKTLKPDTEVCKAVIGLAQAGSATDNETDFSVLKDLKSKTEVMVTELADSDRSLEELAELFAILTILEPGTEVCRIIVQLAQTDQAAIDDKMIAELAEIDEKSVDKKQILVGKLLN